MDRYHHENLLDNRSSSTSHYGRKAQQEAIENGSVKERNVRKKKKKKPDKYISLPLLFPLHPLKCDKKREKKFKNKNKRKLYIRERIWYSKWEHSVQERIWRFRRKSWIWANQRRLEQERRLQRGLPLNGAWIATELWSCTRRASGRVVQWPILSKWEVSPVPHLKQVSFSRKGFSFSNEDLRECLTGTTLTQTRHPVGWKRWFGRFRIWRNKQSYPWV